MTAARKAMFSFTKLVVDDVEKMGEYYCQVYGLNKLHRVNAAIGLDAISELMMGPGETLSAESLVLLKYLNRPKPACGEVIVGFVTTDIAALAERVKAYGGRLNTEIQDMPEHGVRVFFATDAEGHLSENVQLLAG